MKGEKEANEYEQRKLIKMGMNGEHMRSTYKQWRLIYE